MPSAGARHVYAVAVGSNRGSRIAATPRALVLWALERLDDAPCTLLSAAPILMTAPQGPSRRRYANTVALVVTALAPDDMLTQCQAIERSAGRRRARRWGARALDLDLILWTGGLHASRKLSIPHPRFSQRAFVLDPLAHIAPDWRDPLTGYTVRHLRHRFHRAHPVDRPPAAV